MRSPNTEQKKSIDHTGGVLLSAGAGSGKTFVLVEHIIFLVENFYKENINKPNFEKGLSDYLSSIVLMTFTKKAAGELALRLNERIELQKEYSKEFEKWELVKSLISKMTVGTIHSFCMKMIKQSLISGINSNIEVVSELKFYQKIEKLFTVWIDEKIRTDENECEILKIISLKQEHFVMTLVEIFSTPELRIYWTSDDKEEKFKSGDIYEFFLKYMEEASLMNLKDLSFLDELDEYKDKKWFVVIQSFHKTLFDNFLSQKNDLSVLKSFFEDNKRIVGPRKNLGLTNVTRYLEKLKIFKDLILKNYESFEAFEREKDNIVKKWQGTFKDAVLHIEKNYNTIAGNTFSDLEYYVYKGLDDTKSKEMVSKEYQYLIVDEFQDTSWIQYEILKKVIGKDFSKIFCVGDEKQAIYGFRGGELGVFKDCKENIPMPMYLKNNYRSFGKVISFNNELFSDIFRMGPGYQEEDRYAVDVVKQECPIEDIQRKGKILQKNVNVEDENLKRVSSTFLDQIESEEIFEEVLKIRESHPEEAISILYSKLAPSNFLIKKLIENGIGFQAQVKVPYGEDPVIGIFKILLETQLIERDNLDVNSLQIACYLELISGEKIENPLTIKDKVQCFLDDILLFGLAESFRKFIFSVGLFNSNFNFNLKNIFEVINSKNGNLEKIYNCLLKNSETRYSVDFHYGKNSNKVILMTAHSSKGLEFDHVILGGIHTNGRRIVDRKIFGKLPGSFRWFENIKDKKSYKTLEFLYEELLLKNKDFSEGKRLFYVACTRAEKTLRYMNISINGKNSSFTKDSWINGIRVFKNAGEFVEYENSEILETLNLKGHVKTPLFHKDKLGLEITKNSVDFVCVPELSVTRLCLINQCPYKFYLKNICKIDHDDALGEKNIITDTVKIKKEDQDVLPIGNSSSALRGTLIHEYISTAINRNFTLPLNMELSREDVSALKAYVETLKNDYCDDELYSEYEVKFDIFGHMISGTLDLMIINDKRVKIIDFKTGRSSEKKNDLYFSQLMLYAFGVYQLGPLNKDQSIELELSYIDQREKFTKEVSFDEALIFIKNTWEKLSNLGNKEKDHCKNCEYQHFCN